MGDHATALLSASPYQQHLQQQGGLLLAQQQQLGCNVLLVRAAIKACGAAMRALGPRFVRNGRLLRTVLLPHLEEMGAALLVRQVALLILHCRNNLCTV